MRTTRRVVAGLAATALMAGGVGAAGLLTAPAGAAPVGQGFTVTAADLDYILKQIKIAEAHSDRLAAAGSTNTDPCLGLLAQPDDGIDDAVQVPNALTSYGLRTVDGTCNNLQPDRNKFGAADQLFPRLADAQFGDADPQGPFGPPSSAGDVTSYANPGNVVDAEPRLVSNLIVDQTSTNPAAVEVAANPVRSQGVEGVFPCTNEYNDEPAGCTPRGETLFIPNITTDVGLSPPFNGVFTLFGQFFDHGLDLVNKGGNGVVFVPLAADDPLVVANNVPPSQRFMILTRATVNGGIDGTNRDSPFVDQSQTYSSHPSHQVFLRDYAPDAQGRPQPTGHLLTTMVKGEEGMATWARVKEQAAAELGLQLLDKDVLDIPMLAVDPYGNFVPGPDRGMPQFVTAGGLVEGDPAANDGKGVRPEGIVTISTAFLDDIAHSANPKDSQTGGLLPADADDVINQGHVAPVNGTYDDELLATHFITGDGRANENIGLTAIHHVFHAEHNRLVEDIKNTLSATNEDNYGRNPNLKAEYQLDGSPDGWNGERLFMAARFVTEMEYQHLVFEEFARKISPLLDPFTVYHDDIDPAISAEFAHAVYRFGHSMLTEDIDRFTENPDGSRNDLSMSLFDGFLNPPAYYDDGGDGFTPDEAAGSVIMGMSDQTGNEIDEFVTDTLRNRLVGLPLDLATLNMARARETGVLPLNRFRRAIHAETNDAAMAPYENWVDFGLALKHPESLVNFVAAYGTHPTITAETTIAGRRAAAEKLVNPQDTGDDYADEEWFQEASAFMFGTGAWADQNGLTTTGLDDVDLWIGGLAEKTNLFGGHLGSTFNYVFEDQLLRLQNGDRFYYLLRTAGMNLKAQLEGNSFAEMMMRNTSAHTLKADSFATADCKFEMKNLAGTATGFQQFGGTVADDVNSECDERALLIRMPDGTIRYRTTNSVDPAGINGQAVYNGTAGVDRIHGGVDNDTFLGNEGTDYIEGDDGADVALGGEGDDFITDSAGDDVPKGGPGDDVIDAGPGLDIVMSGDGDDVSNGGINDNETFGGNGNDWIIAGGGVDAVFGDAGDDWIEGGDGQDLLQGESGAPFFDDPNLPGHDIFIGQNGEEDYDAEGGDDIMSAGPGVERNAGAAGFDWVFHQYDPLPADADLQRSLLPATNLPNDVLRDRYQDVEGVSGSSLNDSIRGDNLIPSQTSGGGVAGDNALDEAGIDRIAGLSALLPAGATSFGAGNILLGGGGSDTIEGRGGSDIIDGDRRLTVRISVRDPQDHDVEIGSTDLLEHTYQAGNPKTLLDAIFDGEVKAKQLVATREITSDVRTGDVDTAVYAGPQAQYTVAVEAGVLTITNTLDATDVDRLSGIERLRFDVTNANGTVTSTVVQLTIPSAPVIGNVTLGGTTATARTATVRWTPPTSLPSAPFAITGYEVDVFKDGEKVDTITGIPPGIGNRTTTVPNLTNASTYTFAVRAINVIGSSAPSALSNAVTPRVLPPAVTGVVAASGDREVSASWTPLTDPTGLPILGYRVRVTAGTTATTVVTTREVGPTETTGVVLGGLTNGATYRVRVAAVTAAGVGPEGVSASVVPRGAPLAATNVTSTPGGAGNPVTVTVRWTANNNGSAILNSTLTAQQVDASGNPIGLPREFTIGAGASIALNFGNDPAARGNWVVTIVSSNAIGTGPASAPVTVTAN